MNTPYTQEDVNTLYRLLGVSVWHLQHLEKVLSTYTTLIIEQRRREKGTNNSGEIIYSSLEKQQKKTLGSLIGSAKDQNVIPPILHDRFDRFLEERNWVIHKCALDEYLSLRNKESKARLFGRLVNFSDEAKSLTKEVYVQFEAWFSVCGYSLNDAIKGAEKLLLDAEKMQKS